jgi:hypothetical protein
MTGERLFAERAKVQEVTSPYYLPNGRITAAPRSFTARSRLPDSHAMRTTRPNYKRHQPKSLDAAGHPPNRLTTYTPQGYPG